MSLGNLSQQDLVEWKEKVLDAKSKKTRLFQFLELHDLTAHDWAKIKMLLNDDVLTSWPLKASKKIAKKVKQLTTTPSKAKKEPHYQVMPLEQPESNEKPVFCILVGFSSKAAALKAMGELS